MSKKQGPEKGISRRDFMRLSALGAGGALLAAQGVSPAAAAPRYRFRRQGRVTLTMWHWGGVEDNIKQDQQLAEIFPDLFEKINVEHISVGGHDAEVYQQLRLALAAGEGLPDMVTMGYTAVPEFATAEVLMDLGDLIKPYQEDLSQAGKALSEYEGKVVTVPKQAKPKLWFYRKDMFAEAGIDPSAVVTFDDYMAAGQKFHETFPDSYIMNIGPQPIHYLYFMILAHWDDVRVADENGNYQLTSNDHFATLLEWLKTWQDIGFRTDDFSADWNQAFIDNKVGGWLGAAWGWTYPISRWALTPAPDQWGVALWPEFNRRGSDSGGGVLVIPKGAPHPDLAFEYLAKQFLTKEGSVNYFRSTGVVPISTSGLAEVASLSANPTKPEGMSDEDWAVDPINFWGPLLPEYMAKSYEAFRIFPYDPAATAELDILRQHTEAYIAGNESLEKALAGAQDDMESQIGNPYEL
jgi:multiple sugar transport system substrate-binding protein